MNYKNLIRRDVLKVFCYLTLSSFPFFAKSEEIFNLEKALSPRYLGDNNAPIQFVEYVSLTCSQCLILLPSPYISIFSLFNNLAIENGINFSGC